MTMGASLSLVDTPSPMPPSPTTPASHSNWWEGLTTPQATAIAAALVISGILVQVYILLGEGKRNRGRQKEDSRLDRERLWENAEADRAERSVQAKAERDLTFELSKQQDLRRTYGDLLAFTGEAADRLSRLTATGGDLLRLEEEESRAITRLTVTAKIYGSHEFVAAIQGWGEAYAAALYAYRITRTAASEEASGKFRNAQLGVSVAHHRAVNAARRALLPVESDN